MSLVSYVYCPIKRVGKLLKQYPDTINQAPEPDFIGGRPAEDWNYVEWTQDRHGQLRKGNQLKALGRNLYELHDVDVVLTSDRIYLVAERGIVIAEGTPSAGLRLPENATIQIDWAGHGKIPVNVMPGYEIVRHESRPSVLYGHDWMNNYFHHLFDTIPREWAKDEGFLPKDAIPVDMRCTATRFDTLYFPSFWPVAGYAPDTIPYIRRKMGWTSKAHGKGTLYFTREDAKTRRALNESAVIDLLLRVGPTPLRVMRAGDFSGGDQIRAVQDASLIIGPHGAAISNCIFAQGASIIEFVPEVRQPCCFRYPAIWAGNFYGVIVCESKGSDDMIVGLDDLTEAVARAVAVI